MKREYNVAVSTGMPQVAYRESIALRTDFDYVHKKQTAAPGSSAGSADDRAAGDKRYEFVNRGQGRRIPRSSSRLHKGFQAA